MLFTLIFIGASLAVIVYEDILYIVGMMPYQYLGLVDLASFLSQALEKLGIFVDIARQTIILLTLKKVKNLGKTIKLVNICLVVTCIGLCLHVGWLEHFY